MLVWVNPDKIKGAQSADLSQPAALPVILLRGDLISQGIHLESLKSDKGI